MYKVTKKKHTKWEKVKASYNYTTILCHLPGYCKIQT